MKDKIIKKINMYLNQEAKLNHASNKINLAYYLQPSILCDVMLLFYSCSSYKQFKDVHKHGKAQKYVVTNVFIVVVSFEQHICRDSNSFDINSFNFTEKLCQVWVNDDKFSQSRHLVFDKWAVLN